MAVGKKGVIDRTDGAAMAVWVISPIVVGGRPVTREKEAIDLTDVAAMGVCRQGAAAMGVWKKADEAAICAITPPGAGDPKGTETEISGQTLGLLRTRHHLNPKRTATTIRETQVMVSKGHRNRILGLPRNRNW